MAAAKKTKPKPKLKPKKAPVKKAATSKKAAPPRKKSAVKKPAARRAAPPKAPAAVKVSAVAAPRTAPKPKPAPPPVPPRGPLPGEDLIGMVTHYYSHLSVAVMRLDTGSLQVGDTIRVLGHTTDFRQRVDSLQVDHEAVTEVGRRQEFGIKVKEHVRENDVVYKVAAP